MTEQSVLQSGHKGKFGKFNLQLLHAGLRKTDEMNDKQKSLFDTLDNNKNGILEEDEIKVLDGLDTNKDGTISEKEAKNFAKSQGVKLSSQEALELLNSLGTASDNIEKTTVEDNLINITYKQDETGKTVQECYLKSNGDLESKTETLEDGTIATTTYSAKGNKSEEKRVKDGVTTIAKFNEAGQKESETVDNGQNVVETKFDDNGNKTNEIITAENNSSITTIKYKTGSEEVESKTMIRGAVTIEYDPQNPNREIKKTINKGSYGSEIYEYEYDAKGNCTKETKNTPTEEKVTTFNANIGKTEVITEKDSDGNLTQNVTTNTLNADGNKLSQTKTVNGKTYNVEYDGEGNTKGVIVQNGESPAMIAKKFGCDVEKLKNVNKDLLKGKAPNQYFEVGAEIKIPDEINAYKFAKLQSGRKSFEEANADYASYMEQIKAEDKELAARKGNARKFTEQKWNTFEECAIAYYKREGVVNPTKRQIALRVKELKKLNPDLKDGEIKGKQIIAAFSPETNAQIGAGQQARESARMERKHQTEAETGKQMAQTMYDAIAGLSLRGGVNKQEFKDTLNKVNADNVAGLLNQYNEISPGETLIEAIFDEVGASLETRKETVQKIIDALIERADKANVSDGRQQQAIDACKQELQSYWTLGIGYCQTSKLDGLINNLIGTIDAAEALTHEEKATMSSDGIDETLQLMTTQVTENSAALEDQLAEDGWCADLYEGLKWCVGSDNLDENVKADLETYKDYIDQLRLAEEERGEAGFKAKFEEIFGVEYDPALIKGYNKLQSDFALAQSLTMEKEGFYREFESCINGQEDYTSMRNKYGQYLLQIAQSEGQEITADNAVDSVIATQLREQGVALNDATDSQKKDALQTVIKNTYNGIDSELNKYTQGRSSTQMQKQLQNAGSAVFGNKNDIAFSVNDYIASQQQGGAAVNMAVKAAGAIAIGIATGGTGLAALTAASAATSALSAAVDLTDRVSSDVGLKEGEGVNILKNAAIDGASVFAGGVVGKYAAMFKNANAFVQAGGKLTMTMTGDIATGAAAEYLQTGTITLEGVAFQAVFSSAGNLVSLKQLAKTDTPAPKPEPTPAPAAKPKTEPVSETAPAAISGSGVSPVTREAGFSPTKELLNSSNIEDHRKLLSSLKDDAGNPKFTEADVNEILDKLDGMSKHTGVNVKVKDIYALMSLPDITVEQAKSILSKIDDLEKLQVLNTLTDKSTGAGNKLTGKNIETILYHLRGRSDASEMNKLFKEAIDNEYHTKCQTKGQKTTLYGLLVNMTAFAKTDVQKQALSVILKKAKEKNLQVDCEDLFMGIIRSISDNKNLQKQNLQVINFACNNADSFDFVKNIYYLYKESMSPVDNKRVNNIVNLFNAQIHEKNKLINEQKPAKTSSQVYNSIIDDIQLDDGKKLSQAEGTAHIIYERLKKGTVDRNFLELANTNIKYENDFQKQAFTTLLDANSHSYTKEFEILEIQDIIKNIKDENSINLLNKLLQNKDIGTHEIIESLKSGKVIKNPKSIRSSNAADPEAAKQDIVNIIMKSSKRRNSNAADPEAAKQQILQDLNKPMTNNENAPSYMDHLVKLYTASPKRFQKMADSGLFDLIKMGKIDASILKRLDDNTFLSNRTLSDMRKFRDGEPLIKTLSSETDLTNISEHVANGDVCELNGKLYVNDNGTATEIKLSKEKFDKLFPPFTRVYFNQGCLGDCWLVSTLDNFMDLPNGRTAIYKLFEQDGNDILIKFPDGTNPIRFKNGEVLDAKGNQIYGAAGIKMIEQAYAVHRYKLYDTNSNGTNIADAANNVKKVAGLTNVQSLMDQLKGGWQGDAVATILGKDKCQMQNINNASEYEALKKQGVGVIGKEQGFTLENKGAMKEWIQKYANDENVLVFFGTKPAPGGDTHLLSREYNLAAQHAYSIKGYDEKKGVVYITNPWNTGVITEVPLYELMKNIRHVTIKEV